MLPAHNTTSILAFSRQCGQRKASDQQHCSS